MIRASDAQVDRLTRRLPGSVAVVLPEQQARIRLHAPRALDRPLRQLQAGVQPLPRAIDREQPPGLLGGVEEELHRARPDLLPSIGLDVAPGHGPLRRRVVVRQQLDDLEPPLAGRLLDPACRLQVRHGPVALRDALVGDVADERVLEDVFRLPGHRRAEPRQHEVARLQPTQELVDAGRRGVQGAPDGLRPEDPTDDRGGLQRPLLVGAEEVDARRQHGLDRIGNLDRREAGLGSPAIRACARSAPGR